MDSSDTTRKDQRAASSLPYLVLLRMGFTKPTNHLAAGALLPHRFILTGEPAVCFLWHFLKVTLTGRIQHPALWSSDFPHQLALPRLSFTLI